MQAIITQYCLILAKHQLAGLVKHQLILLCFYGWLDQVPFCAKIKGPVLKLSKVPKYFEEIWSLQGGKSRKQGVLFLFVISHVKSN